MYIQGVPDILRQILGWGRGHHKDPGPWCMEVDLRHMENLMFSRKYTECPELLHCCHDVCDIFLITSQCCLGILAALGMINMLSLSVYVFSFLCFCRYYCARKTFPTMSFYTNLNSCILLYLPLKFASIFLGHPAHI